MAEIAMMALALFVAANGICLAFESALMAADMLPAAYPWDGSRWG